ncbi:MAG: NADH-quinone oxidoreductase subunit C [Thermoplasmatales archaeon]|nr:MAG: NADH-quinone oxidoreductase subunit C [Thermoplasmatales archaeon]
MTKNLTPEEIVKYFKDEFKTEIKDAKIKRRAAGSKKNEKATIWMKVDKIVFKKVIKHLLDLQFPHLSIISGNDLNETIELIYHFTVNYGNRLSEITFNISIDLPKSKPEIETICDYIPGALITEREKQEFLGVKIKGIPDDKRLFLRDDFPEGVYPWRRDETGPEKLYRNLHEVNK